MFDPTGKGRVKSNATVLFNECFKLAVCGIASARNGAMTISTALGSGDVLAQRIMKAL